MQTFTTTLSIAVSTFALAACGGNKPATTTTTTQAATPTAKPVAEVCKASTLTLAAASKALTPVEIPSEARGSGKAATLKDLESLAKAKQYRELLSRAIDVPDDARNARWTELVSTSAVTLANAAAAKEDVMETYGVVSGALDMYPTLASSQPFVDVYVKAAPAAIKGCLNQQYSDGSECLKEANLVVKRFATNEPLVREIADAVYGATGAKYVATKYYGWLIVGKTNSPHCSDAKVVDSVMAALAAPASDEPATAAREIAGHWCYSVFGPKITEELNKAEPNSYVVENGCPVLKANGGAQ